MLAVLITHVIPPGSRHVTFLPAVARSIVYLGNTWKKKKKKKKKPWQIESTIKDIGYHAP